MEKSSWVFILLMLVTMMYFILEGAGFKLDAEGFFYSFLFSILSVFALISIMSIPVLLYCYFKNIIPDIDYSINAAFGITIIGIISEFII